MRSLTAAAGVCVFLAGCAGLPSSSTSPSATTSARIRTSDVLTDAALGGVSVSGNGFTGGTTDGAGVITVTSTGGSGAMGASLTLGGYVTRNTTVKVPGSDAVISLIPASFDLAAFDEVFRSDMLTRWTSAPALRIVSNVVDYQPGGVTSLTATDEMLSLEDRQSIQGDLTNGIALLTNHTFGFASIMTLAVNAGETANLLADGAITFARCKGLTSTIGASGEANWNFRADGAIVSGLICVDRDYDVSPASEHRAGVRMHELGHTLGAHHLTSRGQGSSLMNPRVSVNEITSFDRAAARIVYMRPPGNRSPDADPSGFSTNALAVRRATMF